MRADEDDDPTVRLRLGHDLIPVKTPDAPLQAPTPVPPPLPSATKPSEQTPVVALELPGHLAKNRLPVPGGRYARIGAALFAAGVLVGVLGAASVLKGSNTLEVRAPAIPSASPAVPAPVAAVTAPAAPAVEPVAAPPSRPEAKVEPEVVPPSAEPARDAMQPPVSSTDAPSCRELLGKSLANRNDPKRAGFQTVLANRELVRGNVDQAHAAYCLALAWDRSNVDRHLNLARLYLVRRDFSKAADNARGALELDPRNRRALGVAGDAWAGLHETERARTALLQVERKPNPSAADVRLIVRRNLALAKRVERLRDFSLAERLYRRVLLLEPAHAGAMTGLAGCLLKLGDRAAAEAWTRKAKELKKNSTTSRPRSG